MRPGSSCFSKSVFRAQQGKERPCAESSDTSGRVLVRPSGTEPVVRVLAEAETKEEAEKLCATIAALVIRELG